MQRVIFDFKSDPHGLIQYPDDIDLFANTDSDSVPGKIIADYAGELPLEQYVATAVPRHPSLVLTTIEVDEDHASQSRVDGVTSATCPVGTVLTVYAELRDAAGTILPLTDSFRMPLRSRDGREKVLLAVIEAGVASIIVPLRESGAWSVTESMINESLPVDQQMQFAGIQIFVVESA